MPPSEVKPWLYRLQKGISKWRMNCVCVSKAAQSALCPIPLLHLFHDVITSTRWKLIDTYTPNLCIMPINNWMHAHELRPIFVREVEVRQELAMGICSPGSYKYSLNRPFLPKVCLERRTHRQGIPSQVNVVFCCWRCDEVFDFREWVGGDDINALEGLNFVGGCFIRVGAGGQWRP